MKNKKTITVETRSTTIVRQKITRSIRCELCEKETFMLSTSEAAHLAQSTQGEIFYCIVSGSLHFIETGNGEMLVCANSLQKQIRGTNL